VSSSGLFLDFSWVMGFFEINQFSSEEWRTKLLVASAKDITKSEGV
jgi:hypothetical protein